MLIAVEGCAHGELDMIYGEIHQLERKNNVKVDLLICCGDFQAVRNEADLQCMAVPPKFRQMCSFYKYYSGEVKAPILTIFIGGNHEASNYLQELAYGGWVAPNIYYLGYAGVVTIGGIKIAGISGIFKGHDFHKGHFERPPYNPGTMRSAYHVRNFEVFRLKQMKKENVDICISHDWPRGIYDHADTSELLHWKPFFRQEIENRTLGSQAAEILLHELQPAHWFSAHLHVKFLAKVRHNDQKATQFMALDKCLARRKYLELVQVPHDESLGLNLCYDPHWLAVLRSTNHLLSVKEIRSFLPGPNITTGERWDFTPTDQELAAVTEIFNGDFEIPLNFSATVEAYRGGPSNRNHRFAQQPQAQLNPQTTVLCRKLEIDDPLELLIGPVHAVQTTDVNPDEISLDDFDDTGDVDTTESTNPSDVFFIDTQPKRSKLSLPEPQQNKSDLIQEEATEPATPLNHEAAKPKEDDSVRPSPVDATPSVQPLGRVMKRRNQDLYTINPEDY